MLDFKVKFWIDTNICHAYCHNRLWVELWVEAQVLEAARLANKTLKWYEQHNDTQILLSSEKLNLVSVKSYLEK